MKKWFACVLAALTGCSGTIDRGNSNSTESSLAGSAHVRVRMSVGVQMTRHNYDPRTSDFQFPVDTDSVTLMGVVGGTQIASALNCIIGRDIELGAPGSSEFGFGFTNCADNALGPVLLGTQNQLIAVPIAVPYDHPLTVGFRVDDVDDNKIQDVDYQIELQASGILQAGGSALSLIPITGPFAGAFFQSVGALIAGFAQDGSTSCAGPLIDGAGYMIASFTAGQVLLADGGTPQTQTFSFTGPTSPSNCGPNRSQTSVTLTLESDPNFTPPQTRVEPFWSSIWSLPGQVRRLGATLDYTGQLVAVAEGGDDTPNVSRGSSHSWTDVWHPPTLANSTPGLVVDFSHPTIAGKPVLTRDGSGNVNAFLFGSDGSIGVAVQNDAANDLWGLATYWPVPAHRVLFRSYPSPFVGPPAVAQRPDGALEIFATNSNGSVYINYQSGSASPWSGWQTFGAPPPGAAGIPTVNVNRGGGLEVYVRAKDATIWGRAKPTQYGQWGDWFTMGGSSMFDPVLARNWDGRLEIFTVATSNQLCHKWQLDPATWSGPDWSCEIGDGRGGYVTARPAVTNSSDGALELFVRGGNGHLYQSYQTFDARGWSPWQEFAGSDVDVSFDADAITAVNNSDGRVQVFYRGAGGTMNSVWQLSR